jgi:hypothetical protein
MNVNECIYSYRCDSDATQWDTQGQLDVIKHAGTNDGEDVHVSMEGREQCLEGERDAIVMNMEAVRLLGEELEPRAWMLNHPSLEKAKASWPGRREAELTWRRKRKRK